MGDTHTQFNSPQNLGEVSIKRFSSPFNLWENWGLEKLSDSPKVIQLESGGVRFWTRAERGPRTRAALANVVVSFKGWEIYI